MKALAIDTAITCITVAAKNGDALASLTLDIGMRQSEKLLPAIDYVLKQVELAPSELDYTALTSGPGSFTGLRLGFAALKAIEAAHGVPIYAINTLDYYAAPFIGFGGVVLSVIDAHKDKFYAKAFLGGEEVIPCDDYELRALIVRLQEAVSRSSEQKQATEAGNRQQVFVAGEAKIFLNACHSERNQGIFEQKQATVEGNRQQVFVAAQSRVVNLESLFVLAEEKIAKNKPPLKEYDGPEYFRTSEAEQKQERFAASKPFLLNA